jgi:hypothetical protein
VVRNGKWKLLAHHGQAIELFNVSEDPHERWNLMKEYPEIAKKMETALANWLKEPRMVIPYLYLMIYT